MENRFPTEKHSANILYLDIIRICAIYLVILLHALDPWLSIAATYGTNLWFVGNIISPIERMGVPLFFMLSGYLTLSDPRTLDIGAFYKRRLPRILLPFLIWSGIYYVAANYSALSLGAFFDGLLNQEIKYHLWYVYVLIGMYMLAPFIKKMVDSCTEKQVFLLFLLVLFPVTILPFFRFLTHIRVFGFTTMMEGYWGFFIFGYLLGKYPPRQKYRFLMYTSGIAAWIGSIAGNLLSSSAEAISLPFNSGYNIAHYMTAGAFFVLIQSLAPKLESSLSAKRMKYWAGCTYGMYLCHVLVMEVCNAILPFEKPILIVFVGFSATALCSTAFALILGRIKPLRKIFL